MHFTLLFAILGCLFQPTWTFLINVNDILCRLPCTRGHCILINNNIFLQVCICENGYTGTLCSKAICAIGTCNGRGNCTDTTNGPKCTCDPQFTGTHCESQSSTSVATTTSAAGPVFTKTPIKSGNVTTTSAAGPLITKAPIKSGNVTTTSATVPVITLKPMTTKPHVASTTIISKTTTKHTQTATNNSVNTVACSGSDVSHALASSKLHTNNATCTCSSGSCVSPEAFVLDLCKGLTISSPWKPGTNVRQSCDTLPLYSPVAVFKNRIHTQGDVTGILVGCSADGFMVALQTCDQPPTVQLITKFPYGLSGSIDINTFYTIHV